MQNGFDIPFMYFTPRDAIKFQRDARPVAGSQNPTSQNKRKSSLNNHSINAPVSINTKTKFKQPAYVNPNSGTKVGFYPGFSGQGNVNDYPATNRRGNNYLNSSLDTNTIQ